MELSWSEYPKFKRVHKRTAFSKNLVTAIILIATWISGVSCVQASDQPPETSFKELVDKMPSTKLKNLSKVVTDLEQESDPRLLPLFESLVEGKLYFVRSDKAVIMLNQELDDGKAFRATQVLDQTTIERIAKSDIKKIRVNNKLRKQLRKAIAKLTLFSEDPNQRLAAVEKLMSDLNSENIALLKSAKESEQNNAVLEKMNLALNIALLDSNDKSIQKQAVKTLSGELHPSVRSRLNVILEQNANGEYIEDDKQLIALAESALVKIDGKLEFYGFIERVFFGLSLGSVLLLAAIGLSITFGVMGVINMAHGELLMLGAYTTYVIQTLMPNHIGLSIIIAIPAAFIVCGLVGIAIERGIIQFLKGRPLETLLATFGLSLILQQAVRSIFSPLNRQVSTPEWMSGALQINPGLALTYNRLYIIIFSLIVFAVLLLVMKKTALGLYVRAVSQNRDMAKAVGIRSDWVDAMTFGLGSGIAGVAGVALSQLTNVGPNLGQAYIIDSFMVVVFGGVGNLWGTLVGAFSLGVVNKFLEPVTGAVLAQILVLVFIVLFIQKRPRGLFPQKGRSAE
ncbi:urea ABC transporter permease subunit UrtB [Sessilibacter corallicola]|uniref:Urea ABC transporter permease subunit UrtB n=1 Tax=Sessilibacter corallicola TaxID=2904075 RepID=A0ABQ0ADN8_9GAMM